MVKRLLASLAEHERADVLAVADEEGHTALELAAASDCGDSEGRMACVAALEAALEAAARAEELRLAELDCWEGLFGASAAASVECGLAGLATGVGIALEAEAFTGTGEGGGEGSVAGDEPPEQEAVEPPLPEAIPSPAPPGKAHPPPASATGSIRYPKRRRVQAGAWWMSTMTTFERGQPQHGIDDAVKRQ